MPNSLDSKIEYIEKSILVSTSNVNKRLDWETYAFELGFNLDGSINEDEQIVLIDEIADLVYTQENARDTETRTLAGEALGLRLEAFYETGELDSMIKRLEDLPDEQSMSDLFSLAAKKGLPDKVMLMPAFEDTVDEYRSLLRSLKDARQFLGNSQHFSANNKI